MTLLLRENKKSGVKKEEKKRKSAGGDKEKDRSVNDSFKSKEFIETSEDSSDSDKKSKSKKKKKKKVKPVKIHDQIPPLFTTAFRPLFGVGQCLHSLYTLLLW